MGGSVRRIRIEEDSYVLFSILTWSNMKRPRRRSPWYSSLLNDVQISDDVAEASVDIQTPRLTRGFVINNFRLAVSAWEE